MVAVRSIGLGRSLYMAGGRALDIGPWRDRTERPFADIDGESPRTRRLKQDMALAAADREVTVLLTGESGTGKERVARAIHEASPRREEPFVVIDCAGLSATLAEDALFGHLRGAFTGAVHERVSPFERAAGGTVLLDEVGELALDVQVKLLRAIQSRTVQRLGAVRETGFDARIFAATNVNLEDAVAKGRFREDLFYRLDVFRIELPTLRARGPGDLAALAQAMVRAHCTRRRIPPLAVDDSALAFLSSHRWPGNVRELENVLERMVVASGGRGPLSPVHLPASITAPAGRDHGAAQRIPVAGEVRDALARHDFSVGRTAAALGLSRHQLYRLVRRYGILPSEPRP